MTLKLWHKNEQKHGTFPKVKLKWFKWPSFFNRKWYRAISEPDEKSSIPFEEWPTCVPQTSCDRWSICLITGHHWMPQWWVWKLEQLVVPMGVDPFASSKFGNSKIWAVDVAIKMSMLSCHLLVAKMVKMILDECKNNKWFRCFSFMILQITAQVAQFYIIQT